MQGVLTGVEWDLTPFMGGKANRGLEALTSHDGLFYAGEQASGRIYVFELGPGEEVKLVRVISPAPERRDLSGLHFDPATGTLFAVFDGDDLIRQMTLDGSLLREHRVPGRDQEGLTVIPDCGRGRARVFVAQDSGEVLRYDDYPVRCNRGADEAGSPVSSSR